jgi:hypothetical protein
MCIEKDKRMDKMETQTYNGWSNYATWRINLEWFDGGDINGNADYLREFVEESIEQDCDNDTTLSYAMAFLSDVNWYEIAEAKENEKKKEELIYEFNNMDKEPIIELNLKDFNGAEEDDFIIYNITADLNGLTAIGGNEPITIEWDIDLDLDANLQELYETITSSLN